MFYLYLYPQHLAHYWCLKKRKLNCLNLIVCYLILSLFLIFVFSMRLYNIQKLGEPSLVQNSYTIAICFKEVYSKKHWLNDLTYFSLDLNSEVISVFGAESTYFFKLFSKLRIHSCYHFENLKKKLF